MDCTYSATLMDKALYNFLPLIHPHTPVVVELPCKVLALPPEATWNSESYSQTLWHQEPGIKMQFVCDLFFLLCHSCLNHG